MNLAETRGGSVGRRSRRLHDSLILSAGRWVESLKFEIYRCGERLGVDTEGLQNEGSAYYCLARVQEPGIDTAVSRAARSPSRPPASRLAS